MANENEKKYIKKAIDYRFITGLVLIIFLVLVNSFVKEIPLFIVAIPSLLMGLDVEGLIRAIRGDRKK